MKQTEEDEALGVQYEIRGKESNKEKLNVIKGGIKKDEEIINYK